MSDNLGPITATYDWCNTVEEESTPLLRFVVRDGQRILQQCYRVTTRGSVTSVEMEWRDVPVEEED